MTAKVLTCRCVKDLVPTRQPPTKKRRAELLPKRGPGCQPRKRPCLQLVLEPAVHHEAYKPILLSNIANIKLRDWNELAGASSIANIKFRAWVRIMDMIRYGWKKSAV